MNMKSSTLQAIHILQTLNNVQCHIQCRTERLASEISFYCTKELKRLLMKGIPDNAGVPMKRIDEILCNCGVSSFNISVKNTRNPTIIITHICYYLGYKTFRLLDLKRDMYLSPLERQTLAAAWRNIEGIHGSTYERLVTVSRIIGTRTEYTKNKNLDASGPLLLQKGNCTGFADAFYLCASLAGLKVGFQWGCCNHGATHEHHLWNVIYSGEWGNWRMVDITSDDYLPKLIGISFEDAKRYFRWNYDLHD